MWVFPLICCKFNLTSTASCNLFIDHHHHCYHFFCSFPSWFLCFVFLLICLFFFAVIFTCYSILSSFLFLCFVLLLFCLFIFFFTLIFTCYGILCCFCFFASFFFLFSFDAFLFWTTLALSKFSGTLCLALLFGKNSSGFISISNSFSMSPSWIHSRHELTNFASCFQKFAPLCFRLRPDLETLPVFVRNAS